MLDAGDGRHRIDAPATDTAAEVDWTDDTVVLLAVKSHQAAVALADLRAHAPADVPVVCATNGIATEAAALRLFARTYAVCVMLPATHLEPGVVVAACHPTPAILDIGRFPGGTDATTAAVAADLRAAGIESEERADIMAMKRRKLVMNLGNGVDASFAQGDAADELAERAQAEGERVLAAAGAHRRLRRGGPRAARLDPAAPARPRASRRLHLAEPHPRHRRLRDRLPRRRGRAPGPAARRPHARQRRRGRRHPPPRRHRRRPPQPRRRRGPRPPLSPRAVREADSGPAESALRHRRPGDARGPPPQRGDGPRRACLGDHSPGGAQPASSARNVGWSTARLRAADARRPATPAG